MAPERAIPAPFAELVLRALAKPREDRLQTARAFAEALGQALVEGEGRQAVGSARTTVVRCDQCGGVSPIGQKFCGDCGWCIAPVPSGSAFSDRATTPITDDARSTAPTVSIPPVKEVESLPFVAREEVIRWLEERHDESAFTTASAHLVGEAGIGKTRLLREVVARWTARGDIVVVVEPDPAWAKVADAAVRTAVRKLAGWADGPPPPGFLTSASHEAGLGLGLLFDAREPSGLSARERQAALADALRWGIERARQRAGGNRVVVALDDLDFVDGTSRRAFADLLAERSSAPLLLVVTYASAVPPFGAPAAGEMWQLEELPYEAFAGHVSPGLATRGEPLSPLHVDQLLAWARETCEPAPARLADLIASRVERLSTEARHVLYGLAVWGDDAEFPTLQRLLPDAADVRGGRDELEKAGWLARSELGVRIAHPLVRRVVLATIPAGRKSELFASAGGLQPEAPLEVRARHATYGGNAFEALSLLDALSARRSAHGDLAGSVSALRQALELARRELHRDGLDDPVTAILIFSRKLAEALAADGRWSDAEGVLHEALGTAPPTSEHRARLLGVMAEIANVRRHPGEARRYLEEAMRVAYQSDARALFPILDRIDKAIAVA
jgi:serine/threonine-protein kinase